MLVLEAGRWHGNGAVDDCVWSRSTNRNLLTVFSAVVIKLPYHWWLHQDRFTALFPGPPGWAGARREFLDFMVQGKIDRGRHTDHPAGRHSIRTNQCPPPPSLIFLQARCPSCRPTSSVKALKDAIDDCKVVSFCTPRSGLGTITWKANTSVSSSTGV